MNPFTRKPQALPRVAIPGVDQDEVDALQERFQSYTSTRRGYLLAMIRGSKPIYGGTVPAAEVARRRAKNKRAKAARRVHRRAAA